MARPFRLLALAMCVGLALSACSATRATTENGLPETLRVGLIPNIAPEQQKTKYEPLGDYLAERLGVDVDLFVASDYAGVVAALVGGRIDVAYLGGLTYVQADRQVPLTPLVTEIDALTGTERYESAIVVEKDSSIRDLERDVVQAGEGFAFGDPASTSGSLYPRILLTEAGAKCDVVVLTSCPPLRRAVFTGGHDATAKAVLSGSVAAGGLELRILRKLEKEGVVDPGSLRVIETREVQGYPWVIRTELGDGPRRAVTDAFLAIEDPMLLDLLRAKSYVEVESSDYDEIRTEGERLGLVK